MFPECLRTQPHRHTDTQTGTSTHPSYQQECGSRETPGDSTVIPQLLSLAGAEALLQHSLSSHLPSLSQVYLSVYLFEVDFL